MGDQRSNMPEAAAAEIPKVMEKVFNILEPKAKVII